MHGLFTAQKLLKTVFAVKKTVIKHSIVYK